MNETPTPENPVIHLSDEEAWSFLESQEVGRLAVHAGGVLDIYPITYVVDNRTLVFLTSPGTKLVELTVNDQVAFEIDYYDDHIAKSVIVHGVAQRLETMAEIDAAEALPLTSLIPTTRTRYVRITPSSVSGRLFFRS
ncbi:MAG: pyridoxamine 5'-phosphate oxidase family protein [Pontimonas sp.]|nr:pyridoxamine 5'-phosphate oxidase family protein [Pontimonas sp.]